MIESSLKSEWQHSYVNICLIILFLIFGFSKLRNFEIYFQLYHASTVTIQLHSFYAMHIYVRTLHESTSSRVLLCRYQETGNYIVFKTLRGHDIEIIQALKQNPHPHIVEFQQQDPMGSHIAMEYYSGRDFFHYVDKNHTSMTSDTIQRMIREISQAISHIHTLGIVHLDISLENILLNDHLTCHLADFQLAKFSASNIQGAVGKLIYMAPEILRNSNGYDGYQADMWSLGVLFFILLTGNPFCEMASTENENFQLFTQLGIRQLLTQWEVLNVTEEAVGLLEGLLTIHPNQRFSIHEVMSHPYIFNNI